MADGLLKVLGTGLDYLLGKEGVRAHVASICEESISQQESIRDYFTFEGSPVHLESFQHRPANADKNFSLEKSIRYRQIANHLARTLGAINA